MSSNNSTGAEAAEESDFESTGHPTHQPSEDDDSDTMSAARRHWLTNDASYFVLTAMVAVLTWGYGAGYLASGTTPELLLQSVAVVWLTASGWAFGEPMAKTLFGK